MLPQELIAANPVLRTSLAPVHLPGGVPKKGVNKANKDLFPICSVKIRILKLMFLAFLEGPGGFRELREAGRNHFHRSWYLLVPGNMSYDRFSLNGPCQRGGTQVADFLT